MNRAFEKESIAPIGKFVKLRLSPPKRKVVDRGRWTLSWKNL